MRWLESTFGDAREAPTVALVAAHPDDETVGAGAQLPRLRGRLLVILVTDGAPRDDADARAAGFASREAYARARGDEFHRALSLAGIGPGRVRSLGRVDQEASLDLAGLALQVFELLRGTRPDVILTHPYEGGHPDHDATAFAVHAARRLMEGQANCPPALAEMTSYHHGGSGTLRVGEFLPGGDGGAVETVDLSEEDRSFKRSLMACYRTQRRVLEAFPVAVERFRPAPRYDFTRPPHPGRLFYEHFRWGVTGEEWRRRAAEAQERLGLGGSSCVA